MKISKREKDEWRMKKKNQYKKKLEKERSQ
jgi:hypothetical protein